MPVRGTPQLPAFSGTCMSGRSTVMLPVTSPSPKYCTRQGPSTRSASAWSASYTGAPA